jgi:membrane protein implicated in regulation of membrane protease activity
VTALLPGFLAGWLLTIALLAIEHLLWKEAPRVVRYLLGAGALCLGCSLTGLILDDVLLVFGPWCIASAGMAIAVWTWIEARTQEQRKAARRQGEIVGAARGLTQDLIDQGGGRATQRPGHDRQN